MKKNFYVLPDKIELNKTEYENTLEVSKVINSLYKTEILVSPKNSKK